MQKGVQSRLMLFQEIFIMVYVLLLFTIETMNFYSVAAIGAVAVIAVVYAGCEFFKGRTLLKSYNIDLLIFFVFINIISMVLNFKYGFTENILCLFTFFVDFLILYNYGADRNERQAERFFKGVTHFILLLYSCAVLFSLLGYGFRHYHIYELGDRILRQGFVENRLFGIFPDPNYASMVALVLVMVCVYYAVKADKLYKRLLYAGAGLMHLCYVILSGSRTAILAIVGVLLVAGYFIGYRKWRTKQWTRIRRQFACVMAGILLTAVVYAAMDGLSMGLSYLPGAVDFITGKGEKPKAVSLIREDINDGDNYTNNRVDIWLDALRLIKEKPLFGTSPRNHVAFAKDAFPAGYIARTGYMVHNSIIEAFVYSGLMGGVAMLIFIFACGYRTFDHLYKRTEEHFEEVLLGASVIIALMISALTLSALFYNRGLYNTMFWFFMGFLVYYLPDCKKGGGMVLGAADRLFGKSRKVKE